MKDFYMFPQVALLKKRMKGISDGAVPPEGDVNQAENASESSTLSPSKEQGEEPEATEGNEIFLFCLSQWHSCFSKNNNRVCFLFLLFFVF